MFVGSTQYLRVLLTECAADNTSNADDFRDIFYVLFIAISPAIEGVIKSESRFECHRSCVASCAMLVQRALQNEFVIPDFADFCADVEKIYSECKTNTNGKACCYNSLTNMHTLTITHKWKNFRWLRFRPMKCVLCAACELHPAACKVLGGQLRDGALHRQWPTVNACVSFQNESVTLRI